MQSALRRLRARAPGKTARFLFFPPGAFPGMAAPLLLLAGALLFLGCDSGLSPPEPAAGAIQVTVEYTGQWPPRSELKDLRFVAMQFVPRDTADFLQLNRMAISDRLAFNVDADTIHLSDVEAGPYPYSGVAQQFAANLLAWRPVGLYTGEGGLIIVEPGATTSVSIIVDFDDPPDFPPSEE